MMKHDEYIDFKFDVSIENGKNEVFNRYRLKRGYITDMSTEIKRIIFT